MADERIGLIGPGRMELAMAKPFGSELCDRHNSSLPIAGAIKEVVKDAGKIKATNPPD